MHANRFTLPLTSSRDTPDAWQARFAHHARPTLFGTIARLSGAKGGVYGGYTPDMVSGLLNFGTNGPKKEIFIYPHSAGWKKGGKEIGPLPHQRLLCLLGSALWLGSAFGVFLCFLWCWLFSVFVGGLCGVLGVFLCCFWVVWARLARGGQVRP